MPARQVAAAGEQRMRFLARANRRVVMANNDCPPAVICTPRPRRLNRPTP
jgi:hypothetical protein